MIAPLCWLFLATLPAAIPAEPSADLATDASVAVLNFNNLGQGDPEWDWLGKGLADLTIGDLAGQGIRVVSREQMQEMVRELFLKKQQQDPRSVARVLKATRCIHGTFHVERGKVRLTASLLELSVGKQLHIASVDGTATDVLALQKKLSAELIDVLRGNKPGTIDPAKLPKWTENLKASQLLYQGIDFFDRGEYLPAWGLFRRALRLDANYADGLYWSGRMMYYVQEYHQARVDLERFCVEHAKHQRVGDAAMEIINAAQLTAADADEVLRVLDFTARLAPDAEVHNQFGTGNSSTVGLFAAGLATQILRPQERYREAFERYLPAITYVPVTRPLYWIAWHEMFDLRLRHLKATGELLPMPVRPRFDEYFLADGNGYKMTDGTGRRRRWPGSLHPYDNLGVGRIYKEANIEINDPVGHEFILLTCKKPMAEIDFTQEPLSPRFPSKRYLNRPENVYEVTCKRHFHTDPNHILTGLDIEVRYRHDPKADFSGALESDVNTITFPLLPAGIWKYHLPLQPRTQAVALNLGIGHPKLLSVDATTAAILSWKVTARLQRRSEPAGTLMVRTPEHMPFLVSLDGADPTLAQGMQRIEGLTAGPHKLRFQPHLPEISAVAVSRKLERGQEVSFQLPVGDTVDILLPTGSEIRDYQTKVISTPYDLFRIGTTLGSNDGGEVGCVRIMCDRLGRWIVVWSLRRDLYLAMSADQGRTWTPTRKLPSPVNSAHNEQFPCLMQDEEGRFLLMFSSDRNASRSHAVYCCWSEDLINFSAPAMVVSHPGAPLRIFRHGDGCYLAYVSIDTPSLPGNRDGRRWAVCKSNDLTHWSPPHEWLIHENAGLIHGVDLAKEENGRYVALHSRLNHRGSEGSEILMQTSTDGIHFSDPILVPHVYREGGRDYKNTFTSQIVITKKHGRIIAFALKRFYQGVLLSYQKNGLWNSQKSLDRFMDHLNNYYAWNHHCNLMNGDYLVGEDGIVFFSLPVLHTRSRMDSLRQRGGSLSEPIWHNIGQPVLMTRAPFETFHPDPVRLRPMTTRVACRSSLPELREGLKSLTAERRYQSAFALADIGLDATTIVPVLVAGLQDTSAEIRRRSATSLAHLGPQAQAALSALVASLQDEDAHVSRAAVMALIALELKAPSLLSALEPILKGEAVHARDAALAVLPTLGEQGIPLLIEALKDREDRLRWTAVSSLARIGSPAVQALPALAETMLQDTDDSLRVYALSALSSLGPDCVPFLLKALDHADMPLRTAAISALIQVNARSEPVVQALMEKLEDQDADVRVLAAIALGRLETEAKRAVPILIKTMKERENRIVHRHVLAALARIDPKSTAQALSDDFRSGRVRVQNDTFDLMGIPPQAAIPTLVSALQDEKGEVRAQAAVALGMINKDATTVVPALIAAAKDAKTDDRARQKMIETLNRFIAVHHEDPESVTAIQEAIRALKILNKMNASATSPKLAAISPKNDPLKMHLRTDPKLQKRLDVVGVIGINLSLDEVLGKLSEATGMKVTVADNLKRHEPRLGGLQFRNAPAWSIMGLLETADLKEGRWVKTADGYRLEAKATLRQKQDVENKNKK